MEICAKPDFLSREDTKTLKGIAIVLMLMHHLWAFPDRIAGGQLNYLFCIFGGSTLQYLGSFGNICVSLFMFLGGYGIYCEYYRKPYDIVKKLKKIYIAYWKVFVVFVPISFLFFSSQPAYCENISIYSRYASFSWTELIKNFLGISASFNGEWWFLYTYVLAIISFPIVRAIAEKYSVKLNILLIVLVGIIMKNMLPALGKIEALGTMNNNYLYSHVLCQTVPFISCFWMGVVAAKDSLLSRLNNALKANKLLNPLMDVASIGMIVFLRQTGIGIDLDFVYVLIVTVVTVDLLSWLKPIRIVFLQIGKESTNMWLIHSFLCYYYYPVAKIIVAPRWGIPSLLLLIIFSYATSVCLTYFWKGIETITKKINVTDYCCGST